ncbi:MAG: tetratricopeptide repeat protein [Candidatus Lokiarchaeota archaeon]
MSSLKNIYQKGKTQYNSGNYQEAIENFSKVLKSKPNIPHVWKTLGVCYIKLCDNDKAIDAFEHALEFESASESVYHNLGILYFREKSYEKVLKIFSKAVEHFPENSLFWNNIGVVKSQLGNSDEALNAYKRALEINHKYENAWINLCKHYIKMGVEFNVDDIKPNTEVAWYFLAKSLLDADLSMESLYAINECIKLNPTFRAAFNVRKEIRYNLGINQDREKKLGARRNYKEKSNFKKLKTDSQPKELDKESDSLYERFKKTQKKFKSRIERQIKDTVKDNNIEINSEEYNQLSLDKKFKILQAKFRERKKKYSIDTSSNLEPYEDINNEEMEKFNHQEIKMLEEEREKVDTNRNKIYDEKREIRKKSINTLNNGIDSTLSKKIKIKDNIYEKDKVILSIDGANVIRSEEDDKGKAKLSNMKLLKKRLKFYGLSNYKIFCDSNLKYKIDNRDSYENMIKDGKVIETPAKTEADLFILKFAKDNNGFIISNDQFRDHYENFGKKWIESKRITFQFVDDKIYFDNIFPHH